ncbi:MAG: hypothetical protein Q4G16_02730 [Cruoricaptor ignavus]|nr:hypothetical protein [Cruoricaptor ignavus]
MKKLLLLGLFSLILISCKDRDSEKEELFTREGAMWNGWDCGFLIRFQYLDDVDFIKSDSIDGVKHVAYLPVNMMNQEFENFRENELKVKVTYSYVDNEQRGCAGFAGYEGRIKIHKIIKL